MSTIICKQLIRAVKTVTLLVAVLLKKKNNVAITNRINLVCLGPFRFFTIYSNFIRTNSNLFITDKFLSKKISCTSYFS